MSHSFQMNQQESKEMHTFKTRIIIIIVTVFAALSSTLAAGELSAEEKAAGFEPIFNGKNLDNWQGVAGNTDSYYVDGDVLVCKKEGRDHIFTKEKYSDFILRLQIKFEPGGNNGVGIRTKVSREPYIEGMEIQVLDDQAPKHAEILPYQHHGSIYGVVPAKTGHLRPAGEWNEEEILCVGSHVRVTLNGVVIIDADLSKIGETMDHKEHPGLKYTEGHIGLHAHGEGQEVFFRNMRIKRISPEERKKILETEGLVE